ncbi:MAG TPA: hypothetical protein VGF40_12215 [Thermoanaerobaculia bacterium]
MPRSLAIVVALAFALAAPALAHPGIGIVMDARGNVYYTDLEHVWRIAPDGARSIAVRNVHTHELALDDRGNLYGEHLWYEGEATDRWHHTIWRRTPDGRRETILGPRAGFDYSFARDASGAMYWADRERNEIRKRAPDGRISVVARHRLRDARWMTARRDGTLFLIDRGDLLRIDPRGRVAVVTRDLPEHAKTQIHVGDRHNVMGLWTDAAGNVFAAVYGGRVVKRVAPDGRIAVVARSPVGWGPTGGFTAPNGDLWILESSITNAVRVRRIGRDGATRIWP